MEDTTDIINDSPADSRVTVIVDADTCDQNTSLMSGTGTCDEDSASSSDEDKELSGASDTAVPCAEGTGNTSNIDEKDDPLGGGPNPAGGRSDLPCAADVANGCEDDRAGDAADSSTKNIRGTGTYDKVESESNVLCLHQPGIMELIDKLEDIVDKTLLG
jgi:hypothetical protein